MIYDWDESPAQTVAVTSVQFVIRGTWQLEYLKVLALDYSTQGTWYTDFCQRGNLVSLSLILSLHHLTRIICADSPFQHNRNSWLWQTTTATCHTNKLYTSSNSFLITDEHKHTNTLSSVQIKECKCASCATSAVILYRKASWEFGGVSTVFYKGLWQSFQGKLREVC